jgi:two-component system, OmpR family, response regulator
MGSKIQTAMIIDDDADLGELLTEMLEARKIHVLTAHSLMEAEEYLVHMKPKVIFLDNSFPEGLGINFIHSILSADSDIKIVMMTADSARWIREKAMDEGVSYFLEKPFTKKIIDNTLDKLNFR